MVPEIEAVLASTAAQRPRGRASFVEEVD